LRHQARRTTSRFEGSVEATRITDRISQARRSSSTGRNEPSSIRLARAGSRRPSAAIRAEGKDLSLEGLLIEDNQDGVFAPASPRRAAHRELIEFRNNGAAPGSPQKPLCAPAPSNPLSIRDTCLRMGAARPHPLGRRRTDHEVCVTASGAG